MGTISLSHKVVVFEESTHIEPTSGDIELFADNGTWTIEYNNSECEQHITVTPVSGSSDDTIHIDCDGTPKEPGCWGLKFFLDNVFKASLDIHVYTEGNVPDPPVPDEEELVDPICKKPFTFPTMLIEISEGTHFATQTPPICCPACGVSLAAMKAEMEDLYQNHKQWDEEYQDYYVEIMVNQALKKYYANYALLNNILKTTKETAMAVVRNLL